MNPVKTETVNGGTLLYFDCYTDCSEGVKRSQSSVHLLGVGHTDSTAINIEINGFMSAEAANRFSRISQAAPATPSRKRMFFTKSIPPSVISGRFPIRIMKGRK